MPRPPVPLLRAGAFFDRVAYSSNSHAGNSSGHGCYFGCGLYRVCAMAINIQRRKIRHPPAPGLRECASAVAVRDKADIAFCGTNVCLISGLAVACPCFTIAAAMTLVLRTISGTHDPCPECLKRRLVFAGIPIDQIPMFTLGN